MATSTAQLTCEVKTRTTTQARTGMGRGPDMVQTFDWRGVVVLICEGPPKEELVQGAGPSIGITADEVDV